MTNHISLKLDARTVSGKKLAELRSQGFVPSVVYGGQAEPISTQSPVVETTKVAHAAGKHSPVQLTIAGKKQLAIIKSIDIDPVKHHVRHLAFHAIKQNEIITTEVQIHLTGLGESEAERAGLVILQALERTEVKAKPDDLPEVLELSVAHLATAEDKLTIADITLPDNVEFADAELDMSLVVANVYEPSALQAANDAAAGAADPDADVAADTSAEEVQGPAEESMPGGKAQKEPKQSNVDANK